MQQVAVKQNETLNPIHPTNHKSVIKSANILEALPRRCPLCIIESNDDCRLGFTSLVHCQLPGTNEGLKEPI